MSRKTELIQLFTEFKSRYQGVSKRVNDVKSSDAYTDIGREQTINRILEEFRPTIQLYHDKVLGAIDNGLTALLAKWKSNTAGKLSDTGYQAGLSNVIKMLEAGAIKEQDDMQNIIDTYKDDYNALSMIRNFIPNNTEYVDLIALFPKDTREDNKRLLAQLKSNADQSINEGAVLASVNGTGVDLGAGSIDLSMEGAIQFINDRLNDDLSLI